MNFLRPKRGTSEVVRRKPAHADSAINLSETDGPLHNQTKKRVDNKDMSKDMPPDKQLEEKVLLECSEYLTDNLPADDVAPKMLSSNLLTSREHDEYNAFKRSGRSMIVLSDYLLECLRKRQAGFLRKFCTIIWDIEPARYLGDYIQEAYDAAVSQGGFNTGSRDRLSKMSCSDTDIRIKAVPLQGGVTEPCVACKIRKKQNRQLKEQLIELEKEYQLLYVAKIKIETHLEALQDMLQREEKERQNLTSMHTVIVPKLQEVITLIEGGNRMVSEPSGAQQMLKKINDLIHEQVPRKKFHSSFGYSMQSLFSDTSSVVDVAGEEETAQHNGTTNDTNSIPAIRNGADSGRSVDVPAVGNAKKDKPMPPTKITRSKEPVETPAAPHTSASKEHLQITPFQSQGDIIAREQLKEIPCKYIRSDSTPASDWNKTRSGPLRKPRHHSVSGATENSTKHIHDDLSRRLKAGERKRKLTCPPVPGSQAYLVQSDELQSRLDKQRKKIESQS